MLNLDRKISKFCSAVCPNDVTPVFSQIQDVYSKVPEHFGSNHFMCYQATSLPEFALVNAVKSEKSSSERLFISFLSTMTLKTTAFSSLMFVQKES